MSGGKAGWILLGAAAVLAAGSIGYNVFGAGDEEPGEIAQSDSLPTMEELRTAAESSADDAGPWSELAFAHFERGEFAEAERLFGEALVYDPGLFTAKNNLVLARAAQRNYDMPVVQMTQIERAQLLHTAALSAIKQGDVATGRSLLQDAIDTHPQFFDAAVRSLEALETPSNT